MQREGLIQMQPAEFRVEAPKDTKDELEVRVIGPDGEMLPSDNVKIIPKDQGTWDCLYTPEEPGEYKVHHRHWPFFLSPFFAGFGDVGRFPRSRKSFHCHCGSG